MLSRANQFHNFFLYFSEKTELATSGHFHENGHSGISLELSYSGILKCHNMVSDFSIVMCHFIRIVSEIVLISCQNIRFQELFPR